MILIRKLLDEIEEIIKEINNICYRRTGINILDGYYNHEMIKRAIDWKEIEKTIRQKLDKIRQLAQKRGKVYLEISSFQKSTLNRIMEEGGIIKIIPLYDKAICII